MKELLTIASAVAMIGCSLGDQGVAYEEVHFGDKIIATYNHGGYASISFGVDDQPDQLPEVFLQLPNGETLDVRDLTPEIVESKTPLFPKSTYSENGHSYISYGGFPRVVRFRGTKPCFVAINNQSWKAALRKDGPFVSLPCTQDELHKVFGEPTRKVNVPNLAP